MKQTILITIMVLTTTLSYGSECIRSTFKYDHLYFSLCQNHSGYRETISLLYEARAKQLDKFIGDLILKGQLKNKKINIEIYDGSASGYIHVTQSKNNYNIIWPDHTTFEEIAKIIFYFTQQDWTSFVTEKIGAKQKFLNIINKHQLPDIVPYISEQISLWQLDSIALTYSNDKIYYYNKGQQLSYKPTSTLPVKIQDRYLFFQADSIFVQQNNVTILTFKIPEIQITDYQIETYNKWINVGWGSRGYFNSLYTYSYEKNKFYKLTNR